MSARDAHRFINELDESTVQGLIDRLEIRGKDPFFAGWRDDYLDRRRAIVAGLFFGACNHYTDLAHRPKVPS